VEAEHLEPRKIKQQQQKKKKKKEKKEMMMRHEIKATMFYRHMNKAQGRTFI